MNEEQFKSYGGFVIVTDFQTPEVKEFVDLDVDKELITGFTKFASRQPNCVGLAANQVFYKGSRIMKRFFVLNTATGWVPILNPEILEYFGTPQVKTEGCKTWPDKLVVAKRYMKIKVKFELLSESQTTSRTVFHELTGFIAQIFQHEIDHLNGVEEHFTQHLRRQVTGRNELCPCGSGKKYKHCCINS